MSSFVVVVLVDFVFFLGGGGGRGGCYVLFNFLDGKSVMSMFCNVIMLLLL